MARTDSVARTEAQTRRPYRYKTDGHHSTRGMVGSYLIKSGSGVTEWRPSWQKTVSTWRFLPNFDLRFPIEQKIFTPWRYTSDSDDIGDWFRTFPAVRNFGKPGVTFILADPTDPEYDPSAMANHPAWMIYDIVEKRRKSSTLPEKWNYLTVKPDNGDAPVHAPDEISIALAALMEHKSKDFSEAPKGGCADDGTVAGVFSKSAKQAIFEAMNEANPEFADKKFNIDDFGDDVDAYIEYLQQHYKNGDPLDLQTGAYFRLFEKGGDPRRTNAANPKTRESTFGRRAGGAGGKQEQRELSGYDCYLTSEYNGLPAAFPEELALSKIKPWDAFVCIEDTRQQIKWLSGAFPPDLILEVLGEYYGDLLPDNIRGDAVNRVQTGYEAPPAQRQAPTSEAPAPRRRGGFGSSAAEAAQAQQRPQTAATAPTGELPGPDEVDDQDAPVTDGPDQDQFDPEPNQAPAEAQPTGAPARRAGATGAQGQVSKPAAVDPAPNAPPPETLDAIAKAKARTRRRPS